MIIDQKNINATVDVDKTSNQFTLYIGARLLCQEKQIQSIYSDFTFFDLEDEHLKDFAVTDPVGFLKRCHGDVILHGIHRVPEVLKEFIPLVHSKEIKGQFVLVSMGRTIEIDEFIDCCKGEIDVKSVSGPRVDRLFEGELDVPDYLDQLILGARLPNCYTVQSVYRRYKRYFTDTLLDDIKSCIPCKDYDRFIEFIRACAQSVGEVMNLNAMARACGISQPTARLWFDAMERLYITYRVEPSQTTFNKRIVKTAKLYFHDNALLAFLLKIKNADSLLRHPYRGRLFQNLMVTELIKRRFETIDFNQYKYWRDSSGHEVCLILEREHTIEVIDIHGTETGNDSLFQRLNWFERIVESKTVEKTVVYAGNEHGVSPHGKLCSWLYLE